MCKNKHDLQTVAITVYPNINYQSYFSFNPSDKNKNNLRQTKSNKLDIHFLMQCLIVITNIK